MNWQYYGMLALAGGCGQLIRVCYGLKQALDSDKDINLTRTISSMVTAIITGAMIGIWTQDWRGAFFGGLATTDMLEGILKAGKGK